MPDLVARWMGIDITTTEMALAISDGQGSEGFAATKMRGATFWNGDTKYPAFDLNFVSAMFAELLQSLQSQGWSCASNGSLSVACRQHDMVLLDREGHFLLPALSWQCNAAVEETRTINAVAASVERIGRVEERFILPKLQHVLHRDSSLRNRLGQVMTTGDWVLGILADTFRLSSSDALSNGLLMQQTRQLAADVLERCGIDPRWFPEVVQSGHPIGNVQSSRSKPDSHWESVCRQLAGWQVVAGLGDNHASALGCGMRDARTVVVSAGTSGTINLACPAEEPLKEVPDPAARFEFYRDYRLLLRMLPFCGDWYNRFLDEFAGELADAHRLLNELALEADLGQIRRVECTRDGERYRPGWTRLSLARKVASVQFSIVVELLIHVQKILAEVPSAPEQIDRCVLTGGLSQSAFFQQLFHAGIELVAPGRAVLVSGRSGPLRYKTSAYGALLNARLPEWNQRLENMPEACFPLSPCQAAVNTRRAQLMRLLAAQLNGASCP